MFKSLFGRLLSSYLIIIAVTLIAIGFLLPHFFANYYFNAKEQELIRQGKKIADVIVGDIFSTDTRNRMGMMGMMRGKISFILLETMDDFLDARMTVIDDNGRIIACTAANNITPGTKLDTPEVRKVLHGEIVKWRGYSEKFDEEMLGVAVPIVKNNFVLGALLLQSPISGMRGVISKVRWLTIYAALAAVAFSTLIGYFLSRSISNPLLQMNRAALQIAKGDFNHWIAVKSKDEIGQLAETFNHMATTLNSTITALSTEKSKVESIISNMAEGVLAVDGTQKIILANDKMRKIIKKHYISGKTRLEHLVEAKITHVFQDVLKTNKPIKKEIEIDKNVYFVHASPLKSREGQTMGVVGVFRDITEMKKLDEMRKNFIANVSHELRTPLTSIQGFAEALMDGLVKDEAARNKYLEMIHEEALRLSRLTEELLDLAILESGKPEQWRMKKIDLREIIHKVVMKLKPQADAKNIHLTFETREKIIVKANSDRMEQVIINLLSNAIQFTPQGGRVTLKAREEEKQVIVEVIDTGEGIPAVELPYIWDRFYKVDKARTRKKTGGTGLGLSIVKSIIEAFGGRVFVESEIGKGSVFGFAIPKGV